MTPEQARKLLTEPKVIHWLYSLERSFQHLFELGGHAAEDEMVRALLRSADVSDPTLIGFEYGAHELKRQIEDSGLWRTAGLDGTEIRDWLQQHPEVLESLGDDLMWIG